VDVFRNLRISSGVGGLSTVEKQAAAVSARTAWIFPAAGRFGAVSRYFPVFDIGITEDENYYNQKHNGTCASVRKNIPVLMGPQDFASACRRISTSIRDPKIHNDLAARAKFVPSVTQSLHTLIFPLSLLSSSSKLVLVDNVSFAASDISFPCLTDCSGWEAEDIVVCTTEVCRLLRNLCAGCKEAQDRVRTCEGLPLILNLLRICCSLYSKPKSVSLENNLALHRTCLQTIGNAVASNPENGEVIWAAGWPAPILDVIVGEFPIELKPITLMILYNCLLKSQTHLKEFSYSGECGVVLETVLTLTHRMRAGPCSESQLHVLQDILVWTELLVHLVIENGYFIPTHQQLATKRSSEASGSELTETLLLYLVEDLCSDENKASDSKKSLKFSETDCAYLASEFALVLAICKETVLGTAEQDNVSKVMSCMMQFIQLISTITYMQEGSGIRQAMRERGLLSNVVELLRSILAAQPLLMKCSTAAPVSERIGASTAGGGGLVRERGLKRDLVRVIANMCFQDRASQDAVRELGGIPLVLSCSCIDENNPYSREWSIVAIRNLCENNLENQKVSRTCHLGPRESKRRDRGETSCKLGGTAWVYSGQWIRLGQLHLFL
jgi:hypothetical protein